MEPTRAPFFIGELAERTGVSRDTIRYYESLGVLPGARRTAAGYRTYGPPDVERIAFVGQAQTLGLTLEDIADILAMVDEGREPCVHVRERLETRLREIRARIRSLRNLERRLVSSLGAAPPEGGPSPSPCRCRIIEAGVPSGSVDGEVG